MKRYLIYIICLITLIVSCQEKQDVAIVPDGMTEVRFTVPQSYYAGDVAQTKADLDLSEGRIKTLPIGSTLWLSYKELKDGIYGDTEIKPYIVKNSGEYIGLYPCETVEKNINGVAYIAIDTTCIGSPLYLPSGSTYHFKGMYPALDLRKEDYKCKVANGTWVCSNDKRYTQTASADINIEESATKVTYVDLKPLINQTARLHFEISKGENIHTIEMMNSGIEIAGVQNKDKVEYLDWLDETSYLNVKPIKKDDGEHWYKLQKFSVMNDKIIGDAYLLPLDVSRTYIIILINIAVNGIPTQYVTTLNGIIFEHGRSYNLNMEVTAEGNLNIINWQNTSWVIKPEKITQ